MSEDSAETGQAVKARDVKKAFDVVSGGLAEATQNKLTEYTLRALRGEPVDELTKGLPQTWKDELNKRVEAVGKLENEEQAWTDLQGKVESVSSFDRKAFEYGWRIIKGADRQEVLRGIPPSLQGRVDTYMNETFKLAVEKASEDTKTT